MYRAPYFCVAMCGDVAASGNSDKNREVNIQYVCRSATRTKHANQTRLRYKFAVRRTSLRLSFSEVARLIMTPDYVILGVRAFTLTFTTASCYATLA